MAVSGSQLKEMARDRLAEAELLYANSFSHGAYYLGGYAIEFALKGVICDKFGVEVFTGGYEGSKFVGDALKIHNLPALLVFSGLRLAYTQETSETEGRRLSKAWSSVSQWNEQRRYDPLPCEAEEVGDFLEKVKYFLQWIERHY